MKSWVTVSKKMRSTESAKPYRGHPDHECTIPILFMGKPPMALFCIVLTGQTINSRNNTQDFILGYRMLPRCGKCKILNQRSQNKRRRCAACCVCATLIRGLAPHCYDPLPRSGNGINHMLLRPRFIADK
jgi:hypothetical protein